tara:strand:+ start:48777 stop:49112 length:336 start_codon:yes stop_codon:yes gene_type:complete
MSTEATFVLVFAFLFIGMPIVYYILWRKKKKEGRDIAKHFREFNQVAQRNDVQEVLRIGLMLVWNTHTGVKIMDRIDEVVEAGLVKNPSLQELKNAAEKKRANWGHFNRSQ